MSYTAPVNELRFGIRVYDRLDEVLQLLHAEDLDTEAVDAVLSEVARSASEQWADTNRAGNLYGAGFSDGLIITHPDLAHTYDDFCEAGRASLRTPTELGGQGLPAVVSAACEEVWCTTDLALLPMPMPTLGAVDVLFKHGSKEQKQTYLPKMCSGEWAGAMNSNEPQAGSDLNHIATRAVPKENGAYTLSGQKIFITWGDQEMTKNIVHLVLARLPDTAPGAQGMSMFIAPKYLVNADGSLGGHNGVRATDIEHKLDIHVSPTCTMKLDSAEGYLVDRAGKGLAYMSTMMKTARLNVGIEGHAVVERVYQSALAYIKERVQGRGEADGPDDVAIIRHPDVRRMLLIQKATLAAQRALYLRVAALTDFAVACPDNVLCKEAERELDFLIPIVKARLTDNGVIPTNLAVQIYGGAGYVGESGAAQYLRSVRITPIYEGTNGIQAADLAGRKTTGKNGALPLKLLTEGKELVDKLAAVEPAAAQQLAQAIETAEQSIARMVGYADRPALAAAASNVYLQQMGLAFGAIGLARAYLAAEAARTEDADDFGSGFHAAQQHNARVYCAHILPQVYAYATQIEDAQALLNVPLGCFDGSEAV